MFYEFRRRQDAQKLILDITRLKLSCKYAFENFERVVDHEVCI